MPALKDTQAGMDTLERFRAGEMEAFEALFRQHQGEVYRWVVRLVRNPAVAEELTLDAFWRAYRHRARYDPGRPFGAWVRRIATRVALDFLKSNDCRDSAAPAPALEARVPRGKERDPAVQAEIRSRIAEAFFALPVRLRIAAQLALVEECPYEEIAAVLDISVSAVKMRVSRAAARLRKTLEKMDIRP